MNLKLDEALQKGIKAHKAGRLKEADLYYTSIIKDQPKHPDANHNIGVLAVGVGKVEQALPFFKIALEANPNVAQFWLSYVDALIKLDRMVEAKAVLEQAESKGAKGDGFDQLASRLERVGRIESKKEKHKDNPTRSNILDEFKLDKALQLAKKKVKNGLSEEAKKIYQDILNKYPKNKKASVSLRRLSNRSIDKASKVQDPPLDQQQLIISLYSQEKPQQLLEQVKTLLQQFPNSVFLYNVKGAAHRGLGQLDSAIASYKKALSIMPDYAEAYLNMGAALNEQGKRDEAIKAYSRALSIKPDYAEAYLNIGAARKEQGKLEEAIKAYSRALSIKPDYAEAYNNTGVIFKEQGKLDEAVQAYNRALSIKPGYTSAYNNMGNALQEQGKLDEAIKAYSRALSIKPDYAETYYNMGTTLNKQGKLDEAVQAYNRAISIKPDYAAAYNNMGNALQEQGRLEMGIDAYKKALSIKPDYAEVWNNLYFPLQAMKSKINFDKNLNAFYPTGINSNNGKTQLGILDYRLHNGQEDGWIYLDRALQSLSSAEKISIKNPTLDQNTQEKIETLPDKIIALVHFGRSGTGLMHSLIDGHSEVSTLPSIYFSEYFDHSNWVKLISDGWDGMIDQFITTYEVLFDASSSVPVETKSKELVKNIGVKDGMANVGDQKNEVLKVDKVVFKEKLKRLMAPYNELDAYLFFKLVHSAFNTAINDNNSKSLIFYHIHNPDVYAKLNFIRLAPENRWIMTVREPLQSLESWVNRDKAENWYSRISNNILSMLFEIDNIIYSRQSSLGLRLEDLKKQPEKTIKALCKWMGIKESKSLYEMTAQGKKWWGDPSSTDYLKDGMRAFGETSINRKVGSLFSEKDQIILRTLFYPFSVRFGYTKENEEQFKIDLQKIRPMINEIFDFEKNIAKTMQISLEKLIGSGSYLYLRSGLIERWNTLNKFGTYPNMIKALKV